MAESEVTCTNCKATLDATDAGAPPRRPCPSCGSTDRTVWMSAEVATMHVTAATASASVTLSDPQRDWRGRWNHIQAAADKLRTPRIGTVDGAAIVEWQRELLRFYVECYHLKDILKVENPNAIGSSVEASITATPELALLADLANLDKHGTLTKPPRSGTVPTLGRLSGVSSTAGWILSLPILQGATVLDGIAVADAAVDAWRKVLKAAGLS